MSKLNELKNRLAERTASVTVIGMGYVGFPAALIAAEAGYDVTGIEIDHAKVELISQGVVPFRSNETELDDLFEKVRETGRFLCETGYGSCHTADAILICVQTPVSDEDNRPRYDHLKSALSSIAPHLRDRATPLLIVVESTVSPGTTERVVRPHLEEQSGLKCGEGFLLGHCPERVTPGKVVRNLKHYARALGGHDPETADIMYEFYKNISDGDLDKTNCPTAELVKTAENTFRDMQIAFANLLAILSDHTGASVGDVIRLVNKVEGRNVLQPGCGVGGHCLPKDPFLMIEPLGQAMVGQMIRWSRFTNEHMPSYTANCAADILCGNDVRQDDPKIALFGASYLANSDDMRHSPAVLVEQELANRGFKVSVHDSYADSYSRDIMKTAQAADLILFATGHSEYGKLDWQALSGVVSHRLVLDARQCIDTEEARKAGFKVYRLGEMTARRGE